MTRDELLARIRKCLALAKSANEHEAAAALAKARALIDEHGLDQADVEAIDIGERLAKGSGAWTPSSWENKLTWAVRRAIPVQLVHRGDEGWAFIGLTPAPEIAAYAFTALYRQLKAARADYMRTALKRVRTAQRKTARADAYAEGWAEAVWRTIAKLYPAQPVDALVRGWLERRYTHLSRLQPRTRDAGQAGENDRWKGQLAGRDVHLTHGVAGSAAPLKLENRHG